jgi:hypothetical protein
MLIHQPLVDDQYHQLRADTIDHNILCGPDIWSGITAYGLGSANVVTRQA